MQDKLTVTGRVSSMELNYNGSVQLVISVGEFPTVSGPKINGTLYIEVPPVKSEEWQLGKMVTVTVNP